MLGDSFVVNADGSICLNPDFDIHRPAIKAIERFEAGPRRSDEDSTVASPGNTTLKSYVKAEMTRKGPDPAVAKM